MKETTKPIEVPKEVFVANCNQCPFVANGPSMAEMYRKAQEHSLETDHVEVYVYKFSKPKNERPDNE